MKGEEGSHSADGVKISLPLPAAFHKGLTSYLWKLPGLSGFLVLSGNSSLSSHLSWPDRSFLLSPPLNQGGRLQHHHTSVWLLQGAHQEGW